MSQDIGLFKSKHVFGSLSLSEWKIRERMLTVNLHFQAPLSKVSEDNYPKKKSYMY